MPDSFEGKKFEGVNLQHPDGREGNFRPDIHIGKYKNSGSENVVYPASVEYKGFDKLIPGFVFKRPSKPSLLKPNNAEYSKMEIKERIRETLEKWNILQSVNAQQIAAGKPGFHLPRTVRGLQIGLDSGILMTDISENGKRIVLDTKNIYLSEARIFFRAEWKKIREVIEADAALARDNNMILGVPGERVGGYDKTLTAVDPWVITIPKDELTDNNGPAVHLVDVAKFSKIFTAVEIQSDPGLKTECQKAFEEVIENLNRIETVMLFRDDAANDRDAFG